MTFVSSALPMQTRCPDCQTVFLITAAQLDAAGGKARCGRCGVVFDARAALLPQSDTEVDSDVAPAAPTPSPTTEPESPAETPEPPAPAGEFDPEQIPAVLLEDFEQQARVRRGGGWAWVLLIVVLSATLVVQYAYFMRAELVNRFPQARPWLMQMCIPLSLVVKCDVPFASNLAKLQMLSSEVSEHPRKRDALLIHATFVNTASFTQPFPMLEVKLADLRGNPIALRRFRPVEYLRDDFEIENGMMPRTPVTALIEVARPLADVNNYRFAFF